MNPERGRRHPVKRKHRAAPSARALGFEENARLLRLNKNESKQRLWYKKLYIGELNKRQKTTSSADATY